MRDIHILMFPWSFHRKFNGFLLFPINVNKISLCERNGMKWKLFVVYFFKTVFTSTRACFSIHFIFFIITERTEIFQLIWNTGNMITHTLLNIKNERLVHFFELTAVFIRLFSVRSSVDPFVHKNQSTYLKIFTSLKLRYILRATFCFHINIYLSFQSDIF